MSKSNYESNSPIVVSNKILCIGEALIDMICTDKGQSLSNGENFLKKPGGAPTNVAAAIAALGGKVDLAAKVGKDPFGKHLIDVMQSFGVNTNFMLQDEQHFTTLAFVSLMENGERDFVFSRGADGQLSKDDIAAIHITDYSIVHFGSATGFLPGPLQEAYKNLFHQAIDNNCFVSFDPNYRHLLFPTKENTDSFIIQSWYFLERCNFFKLSDEEAMLLTETKTLDEAVSILLQKTTAVFAITIGAEGTIFGHNGATSIIPSIPITPTDTTGAGDAFVGAVLYQLADKNVEEKNKLEIAAWKIIVTNANKAGARTCEYLGAMEAFKHLSSDIFN
jgi:fructokinase